MQIDISNFDSQDLIEKVDSSLSDFKNFELFLTFKADYSQSKIIRDLILHLFEKNLIDVPWKNRFSLISDELVNNSIEYWSLPLDKNEFLIRFSSDDKNLNIVLEVHDTGRWMFAKTSEQMEEVRKLKEAEWFERYLDKRWRWLFQLISNITDRLYFKDKPNWWLIVWIEKKLELL